MTALLTELAAGAREEAVPAVSWNVIISRKKSVFCLLTVKTYFDIEAFSGLCWSPLPLINPQIHFPLYKRANCAAFLKKSIE